jgi:tetratricopeptide (TPR) repeat protein
MVSNRARCHSSSGTPTSSIVPRTLASVALAIFVCISSPSARAEPAQAVVLPVEPCLSRDAEALFTQGHFLEAADIAKTQDTAHCLAFAARATLMHAGYVAHGEAASKELKDGEALARQAVTKDPTDIEGMLQLVIALGFLSREEGDLRAHEDGYGKEARRLIEKAIKLAPNDPWARAAYGGWNAEVVSRAGGFIAGLFYDASRKKAIAGFDKAVALDPDNPVIRVEYATALVRLDPKRPDVEAIKAQLDAALDIPPKTAVDRILQSEGRELLDAVNAGEPGELATVVKKLTPFEN